MPKATKKTGKVQIKLVKQIACAESLGLTRPGHVVEQPDNAATAGKLAKISHLVEVTKL